MVGAWLGHGVWLGQGWGMVGARTHGARLGHGRGKDPELLGQAIAPGQGWRKVGAWLEQKLK